VGSPLSLNSLREDLQTSHKTLARWVDILERFYVLFRIPPFTFSSLRSVRKEKKHYHLNWTLVTDRALRYENMVACHLKKWVEFMQDTQGRDVDILYFRDVDKREVDFIITEDAKPLWAIECKTEDQDASPHLVYFKRKFPNVQAYQIAFHGKKNVVTKDDIWVCPAIEFLKILI